MTNVHPHNRFEHKKRIWYDYLCPHEKEEMTRTTSRDDIALRGITMIYISRDFKQVSLPDDFTQTS
jgi:hypothetical protein